MQLKYMDQRLVKDMSKVSGGNGRIELVERVEGAKRGSDLSG
jgi:hypothetical protein